MLSRRLLRIKVVKSLYAHFKSDSDSLTASRKNLAVSINKTYELYHQMLWLIVEVARYAEQRMELARNKKLPTQEDLNPNRRFVDNRIIAQIASSAALADYLKAHKLSWDGNPELIKCLYNELIASDFYKQYMSAPDSGFRQDAQLVEDFFVRVAVESQAVEDAVEEQSVLWSDDTDFAVLMVLRTVSACKPEQRDLPLLPQYKNDDDRNFPPELFTDTVVNFQQYMEYIEKYTRNWDVDRIAFLDSLIMVAAIGELVTFPSIPVKVTMDEYIEISKYYSTTGSSTFVNGILDKIVEELTASGQIQKTGRGLL